MKKRFIAAILLSFVLVSCQKKEQSIRVSQIVVNQEPVVFIGDTLQMHIRFFPENATNQRIRWTSGDEAIATVDAAGRVIGFVSDTVRITAVTEDGGYTATCLLRVRDANRCNTNVPGFGESLGTVSFVSDKVWRLSRTFQGRPIRQEWSDVVQASNCVKNTYHGGYSPTATMQGNYSADCRSNPNKPSAGHLFSWCAVVRYEKQLCPSGEGWRVPTRQDFIDLDRTLYGPGTNSTPQNNENVVVLASHYFNAEAGFWGATHTGYADGTDTVLAHSSIATYWSTTESNVNTGGDLNLIYYGANAGVAPQHWADKRFGMAVRCVREY